MIVGRLSTYLALGICGLSLISISAAVPKATTGQISGRILDSSGAVVGGASIFVHRTDSVDDKISIVAHTNSSGEFAVDLPEGGYDVLVTARGFKGGLKTVPVWNGKKATFELRLKAMDCNFPRVNCDTFQ
jgi:hypothetical protein